LAISNWQKIFQLKNIDFIAFTMLQVNLQMKEMKVSPIVHGILGTNYTLHSKFGNLKDILFKKNLLMLDWKT